MTDPRPPLTDQDISAVLDGEADTDTVERVHADPAAGARLDAFRAVSQGVAARPVDPLPTDTVDQLIGSALAEAGAPSTPTDDPDAASTERVTPLAPPPGRKGTPVPRWLVAAAVVVLVAVGLGLVWSGTRGGDDGDLASSTAQTTTPSALNDQAGEGTASQGRAAPDAGGSADAESPEAAVPGATTPTTSGSGDGLPDFGTLPIIDLGRSADLDALQESLADRFPIDRATVAADERPAPESLARCATLMMQVFELDTGPRAVGLAQLGSRTLVVYEFEAPSVRDGRPTTFVTANDPDSCDAALSFERTPN